MLKPVLLVTALLADPGAPGLEAPSLYNGVHRAVRVVVEPPAGREAGLVLMHADGRAVAHLAGVPRGEVDLTARMPVILELRRAAYLQMVTGDEPVGSALVLQPMLSRRVPVTEEATNPRGARYTRIVDWYDELDPPPADDEDEVEASADEVEDQDEAEAEVEDALSRANGPRELFSGLRVYPDRDVRLGTTHGDIRLAMRPDQAPNTAWNFLRLCDGGFYDGIAFHRVVPMTPAGDPFVIQAGDPTPTGSGGPGYWLPIEPSGLAHDFGVISMARDMPPDSAGSQIFICLSRAGTARLDGNYCAFGVAVEGAETILAIAAVELADVATGRPVDPPRIVSAELVPAPPRRPGVGRPDGPVRRPAPPVVPSSPERVPR